MAQIISGMITMGSLSGARTASGMKCEGRCSFVKQRINRIHTIGFALVGKGGMMMVDREKVIKGLECCKEACATGGCPYWNGSITDGSCMLKLHADVRSLLKEQEQRINELEEKLRLLEYGDQDILQSGMMPAT